MKTTVRPIFVGLWPGIIDFIKRFFARMGTCMLLTVYVFVGANVSGAEKPLPRDEYSDLLRQIKARPTWNNDRLERESLRPEALILAKDLSPCDVVMRRTTALLHHLSARNPSNEWKKFSEELATLQQEKAAINSTDEPEQRALFQRIAQLRRRIAFKNPLLNFDAIIFLKHNKQTRGEIHMVDQYLGFNAERAGGVFILEKPFSNKPVVRDCLENCIVLKGRLKGRTLTDRGAFISLDLDYEGQHILFAFSEAEFQLPPGVQRDSKYWTDVDLCGQNRPQKPAHYYFGPESCYHVFKARLDGTGLEQLTDGPFNDFDPCFLPNGRIAFISSRAGGQCRCGARPLPTFTLHGMMNDGSDIIQLSWHDTNEWHPSVDNAGMLVYTRWDYIDRDSDVAHSLWRCYPDGRDPRSPHGNYPKVRESRPWMEMSIRAIPGSSKYVAVSAPHHGEAYGSLVLIDLEKTDDRSTGQIQRITPQAPFPESEQAPGLPHQGKGTHSPRAEYYGNPWPLSEDFYLCVHDEWQTNYGIYLIDSFGNQELLYRDESISCLDPIPSKPRLRPPVVPIQTIQAAADRPSKADRANDLTKGTVTVMNVYHGQSSLPPSVRIKELRVINIFPKDNATQDVPDIGVAAQSLCRGVLGTAPVEADGSAYFEAPTGAPIYFQLLDENGLMVQNMRSVTYVHPGENLSCVGCHENTQSSPFTYPKIPLALKRPPSVLKPEPPGSYPLTFARLVQPVLDARCGSCHERDPKAPSLRGDRYAKNGRSEAFETLRKYAWGMSGGNGVALKERQYSIPFEDGARITKLYQLLIKGHYNTQLPAEELRCITLWLDCNSNFYGAYHDAQRQASGEVIKPVWGLPAWTQFESLIR